MSPEAVPAEDLPGSGTSEQLAPGQVPSHDIPSGSSPVPDEDMPTDYESAGQQLKTVAEGAAQGIAGPLAPWAETHLLGVDPKDIAGREQANPIEHGVSNAAGLVGGLLTGTGEAGLLAKAGEAGVSALGISSEAGLAGKLGSQVIKGLIEGSGYGAGDKVTQHILGQGDPNEPVSSTLADIGMSGLLGAGIGGGIGILGEGANASLKEIANSRSGQGLKQFLEDFGSKWSSLEAHPDLAQSMTDELTALQTSTDAASDDIYGASGKKAQAIAKLTEDVTPDQVAKHVGDVSELVRSAPKTLQEDKQFQDSYQAWQSKVTPTRDPISLQPIYTPSASDTFQATDLFKRQLQQYAKFGNPNLSIAEQALRGSFGNLSHGVRKSLEDESIWNKAGSFQAGLNSATSKYFDPEKAFLSKFSEKGLTPDGEIDRVISPGKINTYVNQLGKPNAEIKQDVLSKFLKYNEDYRNSINDLHASLGLESPLEATPLAATKSTLGEITPGAEAAQKLSTLGTPVGLSKYLGQGKLAAAGAGYELGGWKGALAGYAAGHFMPEIGGAIGKAIGRPLNKYAIPAVLKVLADGNPGSVGAAIEHAGSIAKGSRTIRDSVAQLFSGEPNAYAAVDSKKKEKIREFVKKGGLPDQIQNQMHAASPATNVPIQGFAEGGEVKDQPLPPAEVSRKDHLSVAYPEHNMLMNAAKGRVYNYLNSIQPQENVPKLPFDKPPSTAEQGRSYEKALDLAANPMHIMQHIHGGTLTPDHVKHFTNMWPEVHTELSKKMTEHISKQQMDGERPPYRLRQGMSLFMGTALDSTLTPQNIMAAQNVFAQQNAQKQAAGQVKNKKGTSSLSKASESYQTQDQALAKRQTSSRD